MSIRIQFSDGRPEIHVEANYWQTALKQTNDPMAYISLPMGPGIEVIRWIPERETFDYASANTLQQALGKLFEETGL